MKKNYFHILLALVLTFAVTDYIWIELIHGSKVVTELELEKEGSVDEDPLREDHKDPAGLKIPGGSILSSNYFAPNTLNLFTGFLRNGNSYEALIDKGALKLFLKHCQLKYDCTIS